jgi:NADPH:quinone reductase-like Zn-dependent oxidoreductase
MKAIVYDQYGGPEVLRLEDIDAPEPKDDEVRVRVRAAALHAGDGFLLRGIPYGVRLATGLLRPKIPVVGIDLAGEVDAVGKDVTTLQVGDAVFGEIFGSGSGTCAEYACAKATRLGRKPDSLSFQQAAALTTSGTTALRGIRDKGAVQPGQTVLINGASGGVGTFAVQIAKALGAEVTGVCSAQNAELVRSIGADHVIDYATEDFTQGGPRYDIILDNIANHSLSACRRALKPSGKHLPNSGNGGFSLMIGAAFMSMFLRQQGAPFLATASSQDLLDLVALVEAGTVTPTIVDTFPLSDTPEAFRVIESGRARGKIVIEVADAAT